MFSLTCLRFFFIIIMVQGDGGVSFGAVEDLNGILRSMIRNRLGKDPNEELVRVTFAEPSATPGDPPEAVALADVRRWSRAGSVVAAAVGGIVIVERIGKGGRFARLRFSHRAFVHFFNAPPPCLIPIFGTNDPQAPSLHSPLPPGDDVQSTSSAPTSPTTALVSAFTSLETVPLDADRTPKPATIGWGGGV